VQFKPAEGTLLTLDLMYAKLDATRQEDFLQAISFSRSAQRRWQAADQRGGHRLRSNGALLYGAYNGVDIRSESRFDKLITTFTQPTLTLEQEIGETLKLTPSAGSAESKFRNPIQTTTTLDATNVNGYSLDFRGNDRLPVITYPFDVTKRGRRADPGDRTGGPVAPSRHHCQHHLQRNPHPPARRHQPQRPGHLDLAWEAIPDKLTLKRRPRPQEIQLQTPTSSAASTRTTRSSRPRGHGAGQPDHHAHRLRQGPEPARRHAHLRG
jgi:iron complex outermembrane receptor protein